MLSQGQALAPVMLGRTAAVAAPARQERGLLYRWILPAWCALLPFQLYVMIPGTHLSLRIAYLVGVGLLVRSLARGALGRSELVRTPLDVSLAFFAAVVALSALFAENKYLGFKGLYDWLALFVTFMVCAGACRTEGMLWRLVRGLEAGFLGQAMIGIGQVLLGQGFSDRLLEGTLGNLLYQPNVLQEKMILGNVNWVFAGRVLAFGTALNSIVFAVVMALGVSCAGAIVFAGCTRPFDIVVLVACTVALLMSLKVTGFIAAAIGVICLAVAGLFFSGTWANAARSRSSRRWRLVGLALAIAACLAGFLWWNYELLQGRLWEVADRELFLVGDNSRWGIWADYLPAVKDNPLLGIGPYNTPRSAPRLQSMQQYWWSIDYAAPESSYVAAAVETGLLGLGALLWVIWAAIRLGMKVLREAPNRSLYALGLASFAGFVSGAAGGLTVTCLSSDQIAMPLGGLLAVLTAVARLSSVRPTATAPGRVSLAGAR